MISMFRLDKVLNIQMPMRLVTHHVNITAIGSLFKENGERIDNANIVMRLPDTSGVNADVLTVIMNYIYGVKGYNPVTGYQTRIH